MFFLVQEGEGGIAEVGSRGIQFGLERLLRIWELVAARQKVIRRDPSGGLYTLHDQRKPRINYTCSYYISPHGLIPRPTTPPPHPKKLLALVFVG